MLLANAERPGTTNYVLLETLTLLQARLGMRAASDFRAAVEPILEIGWIDAALGEAALAEFLGAHKRRLSLVDCSSFAYMRSKNVRRGFESYR